MSKLCCITVSFNPAGYQSRLDNYYRFRDRLDKQNVNLITVEMAFNDQSYAIQDSLRLHSNSIMWQKERMINYGLSQIPEDCDKIAWLDGDLLLPDGWDQLLLEKLESSNFVQLFQNVLNKDSSGEVYCKKQGIAWQSKTYGKDWIPLRLAKKIFHAEPGFAWGANKNAIKGGLYDKLICGSGDNWLVDCLLSSFPLHHYLSKLTPEMKLDMDEWKIGLTDKSVDYLPIDIYHLWHGSAKNRSYTTRDLIFKKYNFNPKTDLILENNVWEWNSPKYDLHQSIINYFRSRREDEEK